MVRSIPASTHERRGSTATPFAVQRTIVGLARVGKLSERKCSRMAPELAGGGLGRPGAPGPFRPSSAQAPRRRPWGSHL